MKKNILVLTPIYPGEEALKGSTQVVHYFTKEWVKLGYNVLVIKNAVHYLDIFYWVSNLFSAFFTNIFGFLVPKIALKKNNVYEIEGVKVYFQPIFKPFPRLNYPRKSIKNQVQIIKEILNQEIFTPDCIIGHWGSQLELVAILKDVYSESKSCIVLHDTGLRLKKLYGSNFPRYLKIIDIWGYRSENIKFNFENKVYIPAKSFICYSGISKEFVENSKPKIFKKKLNDFIFVGTLIRRKYPAILLRSILDAINNKDFTITFIGEGKEKKRIEVQANKNCINHNIKLMGRISRLEVKKEMNSADCFIMISKEEAFGLVYMEAMSSGCITIASKNEGMDGIIKHGINGFLCEAGNGKELSELIKFINTMPLGKLNEISANAFATACKFTDQATAKDYIDQVLSC